MIIPSIDIQDGAAVQLVGGRDKALDAGDPRPIAERFSRAGQLAVIDLDAAMGRGSNHATIAELIRRYPCRVGGGIRTVEAALDWLDAGARKVILGTAATPEVLSQLPRSRVMAALDGIDGEVVVEGWQRPTGARVLERIGALRGLVGGFLVTFVEREGRLGGIDLAAVRAVIEAAGDVPVTVAGGVTTAEEVAAIDRLGGDAQVGMALYTGRLHLADAIAAPVVSERPDGLWPTVVCDPLGAALGLVWSDLASLRAAIDEGAGIYHSRRRGLWRKGATSGATQRLLRVDLDCDRDALRFTVEQAGNGFCHRDSWSCFGDGAGLGALERRLARRLAAPPDGSYTVRVASDPDLLAAKLLEEADELGRAASRDEVVWEAADIVYFATATLVRHGVGWHEVLDELERRARAVRRRDRTRVV